MPGRKRGRQPDDGGHQRRQRPGRERRLPRAERVLERHGEPRGERRAEGQGHRVRAGEQAGDLRVAQADQHRQHGLGDRHREPGERAAREQRRPAAGAAQRRGRRGEQRAAEQHALDRDPSGQPRRERREGAEREHRQRGQQPGGKPGEAEVGLHVGEQRRQARHERAQVEREQHDRGHRAGGAAPARRCESCDGDCAADDPSMRARFVRGKRRRGGRDHDRRSRVQGSGLAIASLSGLMDSPRCNYPEAISTHRRLTCSRRGGPPSARSIGWHASPRPRRAC